MYHVEHFTHYKTNYFQEFSNGFLGDMDVLHRFKNKVVFIDCEARRSINVRIYKRKLVLNVLNDHVASFFGFNDTDYMDTDFDSLVSRLDNHYGPISSDDTLLVDNMTRYLQAIVNAETDEDLRNSFISLCKRIIMHVSKDNYYSYPENQPRGKKRTTKLRPKYR